MLSALRSQVLGEEPFNLGFRDILADREVRGRA
jgi:hypothetical protein